MTILVGLALPSPSMISSELNRQTRTRNDLWYMARNAFERASPKFGDGTAKLRGYLVPMHAKAGQAHQMLAGRSTAYEYAIII
jgi:hypothetical protein